MTTTTYTEILAGGRRGRAINLRPEAHAATRIGLDRLAVRCDTTGAYTGRYTTDSIDPTSILGQLAAAALDWANTEPVKDMAFITEKYRCAEVVKALHDTLDPIEPVYVAEAQADVCSHGVAFTADCADCEL